MWFLNKSDTNRPVQLQKQARSLKSGGKKRRNCTIQVAKTKVLISFAVTAKLTCAFVFPYEDCWFSHGAAQMYTPQKYPVTKLFFNYLING